MRAADMAMYVAKNTGRNRVIVYNEHEIGGWIHGQCLGELHI